MKFISINKIHLIFLFIGIILVYVLGFFKIHQYIINISIPKITILSSLFNWLMQKNTNPDFLSDIATFEGVLIGVSIPVSLNVVISCTEKYKDPEIAKFYTSEWLYRIQYILFLSNIILAILFRFLDIKYNFILLPFFIWFVFNVYFFFIFIKLVERYVTETDKIFLEKLKKYAEDIFKK